VTDQLQVQGTTKVAIYGLGFLREERLARVFQMQGQVVWLWPEEDAGSWFKIFVLHQNRVQHYKQGPLNKARSIRPEFLPQWLDIVRSCYQYSIALLTLN
jgi:double-strand break repair protein MRE11